MICLKCGINLISIVHLFYGFLPPKVSVGFLLSVSILIGHCDLILLFSEFALHLDTQVVYEQTLHMTRPLTLK